MILLSIILIILGIFKLYILSKISWKVFEEQLSYQTFDSERAKYTIKSILLTDGLVSILCGIYILFV